MIYNIEMIRKDKTKYTWKYIFYVFIFGFIITHLIISNFFNIIGISNKIIIFAFSSFVIGLIGNIVLLLRVNVFNLLLYTINRLLLSIGFYISSFVMTILFVNYIGQTYTLPSFFIYIIMFILMFVESFLFNALKRNKKNIPDKEELALNIYDEWVSSMELLKMEKDNNNRIFLISIIRSIMKKDIDNEIYLINDKMKLDFINECKDLLEDNNIKN